MVDVISVADQRRGGGGGSDEGIFTDEKQELRLKIKACVRAGGRWDREGNFCDFSTKPKTPMYAGDRKESVAPAARVAGMPRIVADAPACKLLKRPKITPPTTITRRVYWMPLNVDPATETPVTSPSPSFIIENISTAKIAVV